MKKLMKCLLMLVALIFLFSGNASAVSYNYLDDFANWPGYPKPPYPINPNDQIGSYPTILGATITADDNGYLQSINIQISNLRGTETLFINTQWDGVSPYDSWDYLVDGGRLYAVSPTFTPNDYILVSGSTWRVGHPYTIDPDKLTLASGLLSVAAIPNFPNAVNLLYTFQDGLIQLYDANTRFVIGMSGDCANDVFLTPVPEPGMLLLLGAGLVGVGIVARRKRSKA